MNNKDEFIIIDSNHYFRKDEIIGFKSIGGDYGEYDEMCKSDYDTYIEIYFKNGTSKLVSFGDDKYCNHWRDAYIVYLEEIFTPNHKKQYERLNEILAMKYPEHYADKKEEITQRDIDGFNADPVEFQEAFENNTIERGNNA